MVVDVNILPVRLVTFVAQLGRRDSSPEARRRGTLRGTWWQHIPAVGNEPFKLDRINCRHRGEELSATIERLEPKEQSHKRWKFRGYVRQGMVFGAFFSDDPHDPSYGTILLRVSGGDVRRWDGFYTRLHIVDNGRKREQEIIEVEHFWSRSLDLALAGAVEAALP